MTSIFNFFKDIFNEIFNYFTSPRFWLFFTLILVSVLIFAILSKYALRFDSQLKLRSLVSVSCRDLSNIVILSLAYLSLFGTISIAIAFGELISFFNLDRRNLYIKKKKLKSSIIYFSSFFTISFFSLFILINNC